MGDFHNPQTQHACRVARPCIYCGEPIPKGEIYTKQTGVFEGKWYTSHYHPECFDDAFENGENEFMPYSHERPAAELAHGIEPHPSRGVKP